MQIIINLQRDTIFDIADDKIAMLMVMKKGNLVIILQTDIRKSIDLLNT